jgi:adenylate kinase family enzyme
MKVPVVFPISADGYVKYLHERISLLVACFGLKWVLIFQEVLDDITEIDLVVNLRLREDVLIAKCLGRRMCSQCGGNFNIAEIDVREANGEPGIVMPPLLPPAGCAHKMTIRSDDNDEVVRTRLRVYHEEVSLWSIIFLEYSHVCRLLCYILERHISRFHS